VPLSEAAARALEAYLDDREVVLAGQPLGSPYLFVRMTNKRGGLGRPLGADTLNGLLERLEALAGLEREGLLVPLRWRAVRKLLEQGLSPQEVARRTGLSTVVGRGKEHKGNEI
jgi:site-specific recombinase XerD